MNEYVLPSSNRNSAGMNRGGLTEVRQGRCFLGGLEKGRDLLASVSELCRSVGVEAAVFWASGVLESLVAGVYDARQQVYATFEANGSLAILHCEGSLLAEDGNPVPRARITAADTEGTISGGQLFSPSLVFAGEIRIKELSAGDLCRAYDPETGLYRIGPGEAKHQTIISSGGESV